VAIAEGGPDGEVRFLGEFPATEAAVRKLVAKLAAKYRRLTFCYEAGPTGYWLYRLIKSLGHECVVVAPSLIPKKPGNRVKTNRRDAISLAKLLRAGELTAVWVPDERHEAMRDLSRPAGSEEGPARQAPADLVTDAEAGTNRSNQAVAALNISTHSTRATRNEMREQFLPALREAAGVITAFAV